MNLNDKNPEDQVSSTKRINTNILELSRSMLATAAHFLIGVIVGVSVIYACKNGLSSGPTSQHIVLCVVGYQLLMAEAILCLAPNSWLSSLSLRSKRRVHWILQLLGSLMALTGCIIKSIHKTSKGINYNTLHGQFGLASMIFTSASLINGLLSLYSYELRNVLPGSISKLTHVCFGIAAFSTACISLIYGFDKDKFRTWASSHMTDALIILTGILAVIIIVNPLICFYHKFHRVFKF